MIEEPLAAAFGGAFDEPATITAAGSSRTIQVIFDFGYSGISGMGLPVEGRRIAAAVRSADLPVNDGRGATLTLRGKTYRITSVQPIEPDGGMTELELRE